MQFSQQRQALANALDGMPGGLRVAEHWPNVVNAPMAIVRPGEPVLSAAGFGDGWRAQWIVDVLVPTTAGIETAQKQLDGYLDTSGPGSLIETIQRLGNMSVQRVEGYGEKSLAGGNTVYLGARLIVEAFI